MRWYQLIREYQERWCHRNAFQIQAMKTFFDGGFWCEMVADC